jgi:hypothetical protein
MVPGTMARRRPADELDGSGEQEKMKKKGERELSFCLCRPRSSFGSGGCARCWRIDAIAAARRDGGLFLCLQCRYLGAKDHAARAKAKRRAAGERERAQVAARLKASAADADADVDDCFLSLALARSVSLSSRGAISRSGSSYATMRRRRSVHARAQSSEYGASLTLAPPVL